MERHIWLHFVVIDGKCLGRVVGDLFSAEVLGVMLFKLRCIL